jgi:DNA-binding transcriptional MerR regulator
MQPDKELEAEMYLIRELAGKYHLTRTSLLHYDSIDLLSPSERTDAGYRLYSEEDEKRLQRILLFRSMGIPLEEVKQLIERDESRLAIALFSRLNDLNCEIGELKKQQQNIISLLKEVKVIEEHFSRETQDVSLFPLLNGVDPAEWHKQFEEMSPDLHREFLEVLNSITEETKASFREALNALPEEGRKELAKVMGSLSH